MDTINLKIYIGDVARNILNENEFAFVYINGIYIPHGNELDGQYARIETATKLTTYIYDWLDLLKGFNLSEDLIKADIYLNTKTNHKNFKGMEIVKFLEKLEKMSYDKIYSLRDFIFK